MDTGLWEKIVLNLLSNAFKFTFEGRVTVRVGLSGSQARLQVEDSGIGIAADELPHLFERFHQAQGRRSRTHGGSGIGLALVHELVELHGGTVAVDSTVDAGSTFTISIPCGSMHLPADRLIAQPPGQTGEDAASVEEALRWLPDTTEPVVAPSTRRAGPATDLDEGPPSGRRRTPRILVADDNADMRVYLSRLLSQDWIVETAADGDAALVQATTAVPDLVLADVMMPGLDGFSLLQHLRDDPRTARVPVVLLSARTGEESTVEGLKAGADDYLIKPFTAEALRARVRAHLELGLLRNEASQRAEEHACRLRGLADAAVAINTASGGVQGVLDTLVEHTRTLLGLQSVAAKVDGSDLLPETEVHAGRHAGTAADAVPLTLTDHEGRPIGVLTATPPAGRRLSNDDHAILRQLWQVASTRLDNERLLQRERTASAQAEERARRLDLLAAASRQLAQSLDPAETVRALLESAVPQLADWGCVHSLDERDRVRLEGLRAADPTVRVALAEFWERFPAQLDQPYGVGAVLTAGRSQSFPVTPVTPVTPMPHEVLVAMANASTQVTPEHLRRLRLRSGVIVPLTVGGRTFAALSLARVEEGQHPAYTPADVDLLEDLAGRAALALYAATRYTFERRAAATLQRSLLPQGLPITASVTSASRYLPGASGAEVGGDWYDLLEVGEHLLALVIGDVMGRGISVAAMMGQLRAAARAYALDVYQPSAVLARLDRLLQTLDETQLTTCLFALLDDQTRKLTVASAGHLPPLLITPGEQPRFLDLEPGVPLGVGGGPYPEVTVRLPEGATVLLYTDGLVEGPHAPSTRGCSGCRRLRRRRRGIWRSCAIVC